MEIKEIFNIRKKEIAISHRGANKIDCAYPITQVEESIQVSLQE